MILQIQSNQLVDLTLIAKISARPPSTVTQGATVHLFSGSMIEVVVIPVSTIVVAEAVAFSLMNYKRMYLAHGECDILHVRKIIEGAEEYVLEQAGEVKRVNN